MSLPSSLNAQDDNFFALENLVLDPDLLYLYSLKDTDGLSEKSITLNTNEASQTTPIEAYNSTITFEKDVYSKIRNDSHELIENKSFALCKGIKDSMSEFYLRGSVLFASILTEKIYNPFALSLDLQGNYEEIKEIALSSMLFDKLPGINPRKWPVDLEKLLEKLEEMPVLAFFHEPLHYHEDFFRLAEEFSETCIHNLNSEKSSQAKKQDNLENLIKSTKTLILINILSGHYPNYLKNIKMIQKISEKLQEEAAKLDFLNHCSYYMLVNLNKLRIMAESTPKLHYARNLCDEGGFKISKVAHFQKQSFMTTSLTTDGTFLYLYISATNGGMYKIGTGEHDTVAGKVYLFAAVCRQEEIAWVYCKGKLYLRTSSKEFGSIDVICPNTFKFEGMIQLHCPEVFGHPSLQIINKNFPLLTDGEYLYIIGKKLISEKIISEEEKKVEEPAKKNEEIINEIPPKEQKNVDYFQLFNLEQPVENSQENPVIEKPQPEQIIEKPQQEPIEKPEEVLKMIEKLAEPIEKSQPPKELLQDPQENPKPQEINQLPSKDPLPNLNYQSLQNLVPPKEMPDKNEEKKPAESQPIEKKDENNSNNAAEKKEPVENPLGNPAPADFDFKGFGDIIDKGGDLDVFYKAAASNSKNKGSLFKKIEEKPAAAANANAKPRKKTSKVNELLDNETTLKLCEFILYEFDISNPSGADCFNQANLSQDKELIQELYESFNSFYSYNECARALYFNKDDISNAAQWLVDEGEKERTKKTMMVRSSTLLAQAEVVSDISNKNIKNNAEILTKEDSVIFPVNVSANIWTMNKEQLALYSEHGIKIFSKNPADIKPLELKKPAAAADLLQNPKPSTETASFFPGFNEDFWKKAVNSNEIEAFEAAHDLAGLSPENLPFWMKNSNLWKEFPQNKEPIPPPEILKDAILNKLPKKFILKGTHIKTIEGSRKGFHPHTNFHMCYDPFAKKFYVMNWNWNSYTNVLPSLITIAYDYENYEEKEFLIALNGLAENNCSSKAWFLQQNFLPSPEKGEEIEENAKKKPQLFNETQEALNVLVGKLMKLQRKRFVMPWILNNWEYAYGYGLVEIVNKKAIVANLKAEDTKKRLNSQRNKLVSRLNKHLLHKSKKPNAFKTNPLQLVEIKKLYAGCMDGSSETFAILFEFSEESLKNLKEIAEKKDFELLYLWLQNILLWVKHADILAAHAAENSRKYQEFEEICYELLKDPSFYHDLPTESPCRMILSLLWRILAQGYEFFLRTSQKQAIWLRLVLRYSNINEPSFRYVRRNEHFEGLCYEYRDLDEYDMNPLSYFFMRLCKWNETILPDYPLRESLIEALKPEEFVKSVDNNTNFFNSYRKARTVKVQQKTLIEPLGRLLVSDLTFLYHVKPANNLFESFYPEFFIEKEENGAEFCEETVNIEGVDVKLANFNPTLKLSKQKLQQHAETVRGLWDALEELAVKALESPAIDGLLVLGLVNSLFLEAFLEISRIEDGFFEACHLKKLARRMLQFVERMVEQGLKSLISLSNSAYVSKVLSIFSSMLSTVFPLLQHSSLMKFNAFDQELEGCLLRILENLLKYTEISTKAGAASNILQELFLASNEGIEQTNEKVYETNHPYERGKVQAFDQHHFPGALAISIELDKRCQSDNNDSLIIAGWYSHHASNMSLQMSPRDGVGTCFRVAGKPNLKRPLVLLGNTIQVEFSASGHAKDEQSLNRWGFKAIAKGIYGSYRKCISTQKSENSDFSSLLSLFGGDKSLIDWLHGLKSLVLLLTECVEKKLKGTRLSPKEIENASFLKWALLKRGLSGLFPKDFLRDVPQGPLCYKETSNDQFLFEREGVAEEPFDIESQSAKLKSLIKQSLALQNELREDPFALIKNDLRSRVLKERILLPEEIKKTLEKSLEKPQKSEENKENIAENQEIPAALRVDDAYFQSLLQEIREKKGKAFDLVAQVKALYPEPQNLRNEKLRPRFTKELKEEWEFAENLIILCFLYHTRLVSAPINNENLSYFKEQLALIGLKKNNILEFMIAQVQNEREWQFAVQELDEIQRNFQKTLIKVEETPPPSQISAKTVENKAKREKKANKKQEERKQIEEKQEESKKDDASKRNELEEKLENDLWKAFQQRYANNIESIRSLCLLKDIAFNEEDPNVGLKEFYNLCKAALQGVSSSNPITFESPYLLVARLLVSKCLFLLKLGSFQSIFCERDASQLDSPATSSLTPLQRNPTNFAANFTGQGLAQTQELAPLGLGRSISCQVEEKIVDKEKLESFRVWIDSYQKWKLWQAKHDSAENELETETSSPYQTIGSFLCSKLSVRDLQFCLMRQNFRCGKRVQGFELWNGVYAKVQGTLLEKYVLGTQNTAFRFDFLRNIRCAGQELKEMLLEPFFEGLRALILAFNRKFERMKAVSLEDLAVEINKIKQGGKFSELYGFVKEFLRVLYLNLAEIACLCGSNIEREFWDAWIEDPSGFMRDFLRNIVNLSLFCKALAFLSHNFEDFSLLTMNISQVIWLLLSRVVEKLKDFKPIARVLSILLGLLGKELGLYEGKLLFNVKLLPRLNDLATIQRIETLLAMLYNLFVVHENKLAKKGPVQETLQKQGAVLYFLLYFASQPSLLRLLSKSLTILAPFFSMESLQTVYNLEYFAKLALNYEDLGKNNKAQSVHQLIKPMLIVKEVAIEKPQSQFPVNNLTLILEKLGQAILIQEDEKSLRKVLEGEVSRLTKDLDYSKSLAMTLAHHYSISSDQALQDDPLGLLNNSKKASKQCSSTSSLKSANMNIEKNNFNNNNNSSNSHNNRDTVVLIQLAVEEDISFLVTVFFYWEELYPSFSLKYAKTLEDFYKQKEEKEKRENEQKLNSLANSQNIEKCQPGQNAGLVNLTQPPMFSHKIFEKLIVNQPDFNLLDEDSQELPFAWYLNYMGVFPDMKCPKSKTKQGKTKKSVKKVWANANLLKLEKKYESLYKSFEEIKEADSLEDKHQALLARNFIARMLHHIKDAKNVATMLNVFGFAPVLMGLPHKRASELGYLIHLGINNLLKPLNLEFFKEELRKKLDPSSPFPQNPPANPPGTLPKTPVNKAQEPVFVKSQMVISMCDQTIYQNFDFTIDFVTSLVANKDNFYTDCNKFSIVHRVARSGSSNCSLIHEMIEFLRASAQNNANTRGLLQKYLFELTSSLSYEDRWLQLSQFDRNIFVGLCNVIGGWTQTLRCGALTCIKKLDVENLCVVTQGGYTSGKKHCNIISRNDASLSIQTVKAEELELRFLNEWDKSCVDIDFCGLLESIRGCYLSYTKLKTAKSREEVEVLSLSIIVRSLLQIAATVDWNHIISVIKLPEDLLKEFLRLFLEICQFCPVDNSYFYHDQSFADAWEKLVDKLEPSNQLFSIPQNFESSQAYDFELEKKSVLASKPSERNPSDLENAGTYVLPPSNYIDSLPEHQQQVSEHKMLKYWEKHIIPRIQDFVRSSLKPWEYEDFFEQLRQPLRKGDQAKAAEVAYILCDQRLPAGVVLPDVNHDWSTITIEEVQIGQWAVAKLAGVNNKLYSQFFAPQLKLGNSELCVQMLAVDGKSSSVLVMYQDHENLQLVSIWLPVLALKLPEIPLKPHVACLDFSIIYEEFMRTMNNSIALLTRQVLLRFFSIEGYSKAVDLRKEEKLLKQFNLPLIQIIKWSVLDELSEDPVEGWLEESKTLQVEGKGASAAANSLGQIHSILQNKRENKAAKLKEIQIFLNWLAQAGDTEHIPALMTWLGATFPQICEFISRCSNYVNLSRASVENNHVPFSLNTFSFPENIKDSISALCVSFKQEATLCLCSGLKFFSDESGINIIHHIQAGKEAKTKLKPLLFKMSNVWCNYYFNAEALPPYLQNQSSTNLPALVSGVPSSWSVCCWLIDSLGSAFMSSGKENSLSLLSELNKILIQGLEKLRMPVILKELLAKLLVRNVRKLQHVLFKNPQWYYKETQWVGPESNQMIMFEPLGIKPSFVLDLVQEIAKLKESQSLELYILYSSYIQQIMELSMTVVLPYAPQIEATKSLSTLFPEEAKNLPEGLGSLFNLLVVCNFIKEEGLLTRELFKECMDNIKLETQWDRFIYIENLPFEWSSEYILTSLSEIISRNKGRVLLPTLDFYLPIDAETGEHKGICMILLDGWAVMDIEDVVASTEKKEENIEEVPAAQEEELMNEELKDQEDVFDSPFWICEVCTLENADNLTVCSICEAPRPARKAPVLSEKEIALQLKRNDLSEVEKEIQKKDQLRFEKFLQDINEFVLKFYEEKSKEKPKSEEKKACEENLKESLKEESKEDPKEAKKKQRKAQKDKKKQEKLLKKQEVEKKKAMKKEIKRNKKKGIYEEIEEVGPEAEAEEEDKQKAEQPIKLNENPQGNEEISLPKPEENVAQSPEIKQAPLQEILEENLAKSPEFSKSEKTEDFSSKAKKCLVLFGSQLLDNKAANQCLKEMLLERAVCQPEREFKPCIIKVLKSIYQEIITKFSDKGLKEKLQKYNSFIDYSSCENFIAQLLSQTLVNPFDFWKLLETLGFDLWASNSGHHCAEIPQLLPLKMLSELMKYIEIELCQETKAVLTYSPLNIRLMNKSPLQENSEKPSINYFNEITLESKYYQLCRYNIKELRFAWSLLKIFNANLIPTIPFINMRTNNYFFENIWLSLSTYLSCFREIWVMPIKRELSHKVLQKTAVNREEVPKITLERLRLNKETNKPVPKTGITLKNKEDFIFTKSFEQLKDLPTTLLRPLKPQGAEPHIAFEVIFKGENVMGEAGPYRQFFADISMELQPSALNPYSVLKNLNLLCPSPNNDAKLGKGRDKFVVNPSAKSSFHLQLFEFLGILMGCSVRTGTHLTLDLPLLFWKQLVGQRIELEDLEEVDESLKDLLNIIQNYSRAQFEETIMETFSTTLSNKTVVELKKNGSKIPVLYEDRFEYVQKVLQARMKESVLQIEAIKKGLTLMIPLPFLNAISAKDLEIWVCGKPKVNIELLRRHTRYAGELNEESRRVKFLWEVLAGLKENEKLRFVKFCWGQERLPANDEEFERTQTRFMIKPASYVSSNPDKALPRADTCFFNLELPDYSSKEVLKERFILAINTDCDSMNAEDPRNLDPNLNVDRDESSYDQEEEE